MVDINVAPPRPVPLPDACCPLVATFASCLHLLPSCLVHASVYLHIARAQEDKRVKEAMLKAGADDGQCRPVKVLLGEGQGSGEVEGERPGAISKFRMDVVFNLPVHEPVWQLQQVTY